MALGKSIARLARQVQQRRAGSGEAGREPHGKQLDEGPRSAYELVTRRALEDLTKDFERLETKVNGLLFGVLLTFLLEIWKSFR